jgi:two-component system OmpR family response regulator
MTYTIALVEDDSRLQANYASALEREGYEVTCHSSRKEAMAAFAAQLPDLAILDVMLGDEMAGGFDLCLYLRSLSPAIPIIFLTARNSDLDRVSGLRLGAWDYLTKDTTTLDFLPARITALFRTMEVLQSAPSAGTPILEHGDLRLDEDRKEVHWKHKQLSLTLTEFWILLALARRPGHVKNHDQLMDAAQVVVTNNAIAAHIRRIRDKFRETDPAFDAIRSEYGMGYRWQL